VLSIGQQDTITKLLPYLRGKSYLLNITKLKFHIELIDEEDDEVLFAIAEEFGNIFNLVQDKTVFIEPLETLCKLDETVVREAASKSLVKICESLSDSEI
jgi:hypothetical protein